MAMTTSTTNDQKILVGHNHPVNHVISSIESSPPPPPAAGIKSSKIWFWPRLLLPQRFFPALAFGSISLIFIFLSMSLPSPLTIYIPPLSFLSNFIHSHGDYTSQMQEIHGDRSYIAEEAIALEEVLRTAAYTENEDSDGHGKAYHGNHSLNHDSDESSYESSKKTVIITTINAAWANNRINDENTKENQNANMVDMFLESLREGLGTRRLIRHVVMGCMDQRSFDRCKALTASSHDHISSRNEDSDHVNKTKVSRTYLDTEESKDSMEASDQESKGSMEASDQESKGSMEASDQESKGSMEVSDRSGAESIRQETHNFQCIRIHTPGVDFSGEQLLLTSDYIKMMWRRIEFLTSVLQLGYNFIFTDADVLWFRDPFPLLLSNNEVDFQIACDRYNGIPSDLNNSPNAGFTYVKANKRTIDFYKYWYAERKRDDKMADQEVLNAIKFEDKFKSIGLTVRFLDTQFFGGFCAFKTTDMNKVMTMHANCCKGLEAKLKDLHMILDDWKKWKQEEKTSPTMTSRDNNNKPQSHSDPYFRLPWACPQSWFKH